MVLPRGSSFYSEENPPFQKVVIGEREPTLYWDSTYAIARALIDTYPKKKPEETGLEELLSLVAGLRQFNDDIALATDRMLLDIQITWFEELSDE